MPDKELSPDEVIFLANALDGPVLAFEPLNDPMIIELVQRKLVAIRPSSDPQHSLVDITDAGRKAVSRDLKSQQGFFNSGHR